MKWPCRHGLILFCGAVLLWASAPATAEHFRVATYNLAGYVGGTAERRTAKSAESKAKVCEMIQSIRPDVIALQEVGGVDMLLELRDSLRSAGLDLPHWELVAGHDTNIHLAVLSRFPFQSRPHTNDSFLLGGRRFKVLRGFAEVEVQVTPAYSFTLLTAHLKSKRPVVNADESEQRLAEARVLREKIDARLAADPEANLVVLGDLNDHPASASSRVVLGRGRNRLVDTRPTERPPNESGGATGNGPLDVAWTYYYAQQDSYSRVDYLLLSRGMAREWLKRETYVWASAAWNQASDHRPLVAAFEAEER